MSKKQTTVALSVSGKNYEHLLSASVPAKLTKDEESWAVSGTAHELLEGLQRLLGTHPMFYASPAVAEDHTVDAPVEDMNIPPEQGLTYYDAVEVLNRAVTVVEKNHQLNNVEEFSLNELLNAVVVEFANITLHRETEVLKVDKKFEEEDARAAEPVAEASEPEPERVEYAREEPEPEAYPEEMTDDAPTRVAKDTKNRRRR